ncbi:MAG: FHA domain-containing protein [Bdellovibrionales bacterium]|nr:FHA domain-containing protein [Bdellovibrionales bacterium]
MVKGGVAPALSPGFEFSLVIVSGADIGSAFRLTGKKISIGRGQDNAIQLANDMKCSRHHAVIEFTDKGIEIENISDNNHVLVDNKEIHRTRIKHGSIIVIGETTLQLNVKPVGIAAAPGGGLQVRPDSAPLAGGGGSATAGSTPDQAFSPSRRTKSGGGMFKLLIIVVGLLAVYLFTSTPNKNKDATAIRTDEAVEAEIEKANKLREEAIARKTKAGENSQQYESAQATYVRGFRDYQQGNFDRAAESFQACLSIFPNHVLCNRYLGLARRRFNELVQYHMILGRKYREQGQYSACRASFRNVMVMVLDINSAIYKEAKANYDACDTMLKDRF